MFNLHLSRRYSSKNNLIQLELFILILRGTGLGRAFARRSQVWKVGCWQFKLARMKFVKRFANMREQFKRQHIGKLCVFDVYTFTASHGKIIFIQRCLALLNSICWARLAFLMNDVDSTSLFS